MDHLEKGKQLAREGNYEDALDAFLLALENDKENADIHFFIGHCYSSMEEFGYAKFHYQVAQSLDPNNPKLNVIWDTIKNVEAQKPPERKLTRAAAAKERRSQTRKSDKLQSDETHSDELETNNIDFDPSESSQSGSRYKLTDDQWEQAFPSEQLTKQKEEPGFFLNFIVFLIVFALLGVGIFFVLRYFEMV